MYQNLGVLIFILFKLLTRNHYFCCLKVNSVYELMLIKNKFVNKARVLLHETEEGLSCRVRCSSCATFGCDNNLL